MVYQPTFYVVDVIVMIGLKTYAPILGRHLAMTADAIYERQRVFVRTGYFVPPSGRGPGSGVRAEPLSVAKMIISALATDALAEVDAKTRELAGKAPQSGKRCQLTGAKTFLAALSDLLVSPGKLEMLTSIAVDRRDLSAEINWQQPGKKLASAEYFGRTAFDGHEGLSLTAQLGRWDLQCISLELSEIADGLAPLHPDMREIE